MVFSFSRLVRFRASDGQIYYGEAGDTWQESLKGLEVETFIGSSPFDLSPSGKKAVISEVRFKSVLSKNPANISLIHPRSCVLWPVCRSS
jgi:hypothetical protein